MLRNLTLAALGFSLFAFGALSFVSGGGARAATINIDVGDFYFCSPANSGGVCDTAVNVGDTVTWLWVGSATHTVTECDAAFSTCPPAGGFDSGRQANGATFSHVFNTAGTVAYRCNVHTTLMRGRVVVSAQSTGTATPTTPPAPTEPPPAATEPPASPEQPAPPQEAGTPAATETPVPTDSSTPPATSTRPPAKTATATPRGAATPVPDNGGSNSTPLIVVGGLLVVIALGGAGAGAFWWYRRQAP